VLFLPLAHSHKPLPPLCTAPPARVSLSLVMGAVSPCVQCWAARWHPPPALGGGLLRSWRVLTLLWGGGRGCSESGWGQLCSVGVQGVCAGGRIRLPPKTLSGDDARVCPPSTHPS
jgi:hypothetical protein